MISFFHNDSYKIHHLDYYNKMDNDYTQLTMLNLHVI
jgi:hypothetical protein